MERNSRKRERVKRIGEGNKMKDIKVEALKNGKYAIYVKGNYTGQYSKAVTNIKLRGWNLPEIEI